MESNPQNSARRALNIILKTSSVPDAVQSLTAEQLRQQLDEFFTTSKLNTAWVLAPKDKTGAAAEVSSGTSASGVVWLVDKRDPICLMRRKCKPEATRPNVRADQWDMIVIGKNAPGFMHADPDVHACIQRMLPQKIQQQLTIYSDDGSSCLTNEMQQLNALHGDASPTTSTCGAFKTTGLLGAAGNTMDTGYNKRPGNSSTGPSSNSKSKKGKKASNKAAREAVLQWEEFKHRTHGKCWILESFSVIEVTRLRSGVDSDGKQAGDKRRRTATRKPAEGRAAKAARGARRKAVITTADAADAITVSAVGDFNLEEAAKQLKDADIDDLLCTLQEGSEQLQEYCNGNVLNGTCSMLQAEMPCGGASHLPSDWNSADWSLALTPMNSMMQGSAAPDVAAQQIAVQAFQAAHSMQSPVDSLFSAGFVSPADRTMSFGASQARTSTGGSHMQAAAYTNHACTMMQAAWPSLPQMYAQGNSSDLQRTLSSYSNNSSSVMEAATALPAPVAANIQQRSGSESQISAVKHASLESQASSMLMLQPIDPSVDEEMRSLLLDFQSEGESGGCIVQQF